MNRLSVLYDVTKQLDNVLDEPVNTANRESIIEQVNDLIEKRGVYLEKVSPPFTEDEKLIGQKIVPLNKKIQQQMNEIFNDLKQEMQQVKKQKKSNRSYTNPYEKVNTIDGMFLDNKL